jgi:hypothetical protein
VSLIVGRREYHLQYQAEGSMDSQNEAILISLENIINNGNASKA